MKKGYRHFVSLNTALVTSVQFMWNLSFILNWNNKIHWGTHILCNNEHFLLFLCGRKRYLDYWEEETDYPVTQAVKQLPADSCKYNAWSCTFFNNDKCWHKGTVTTWPWTTEYCDQLLGRNWCKFVTLNDVLLFHRWYYNEYNTLTKRETSASVIAKLQDE